MKTKVIRSGRANETAGASLIVSGKIDAGIKVPTSDIVNNHPKGVEKYHKGLEMGASFDTIDKVMRAQLPDTYKKPPLRMVNVPYFRACQEKFDIPGAAQTLMDLYGSERMGTEGKHLYSFPILFPSDDIDEVFFEGYTAWKFSGKLYWNEGDRCMRYAEKKADKSKRSLGPRATEDYRACVPDKCPEFQSGVCTHNGTLFFHVPGLTGVGVVRLDFKSIYAKLGVFDILSKVLGGLKRISGTYKGKPIFMLSKSLRMLTQIDPATGRPKKREHEVITLEAPGLDMFQLMLDQEAAANVPQIEREPEMKALTVDEPVEQADTKTEQAIANADAEKAEQAKADAEFEANKTKQLVKQMRQVLSDEMKRLNLDGDSLLETISAFGFVKTDTRDYQKLIDIVEKLKIMKAPPTVVDEAVVAVDEPPPIEATDDDEVPF